MPATDQSAAEPPVLEDAASALRAAKKSLTMMRDAYRVVSKGDQRDAHLDAACSLHEIDAVLTRLEEGARAALAQEPR